MVQSYRNTRKGFYTDCYQDTTPIGTIVPNLKSGANTYDHEFVNNLHHNTCTSVKNGKDGPTEYWLDLDWYNFTSTDCCSVLLLSTDLEST